MNWKKTQQDISKVVDTISNSIKMAKDNKIIDATVKTALPFVPGIGPVILEWYDNFGGSENDSENAKQIACLLSSLKEQTEEKFLQISEQMQEDREQFTQKKDIILNAIYSISNQLPEIKSSLNEIEHKAAQSELDHIIQTKILHKLEGTTERIENKQEKTMEMIRDLKDSQGSESSKQELRELDDRYLVMVNIFLVHTVNVNRTMTFDEIDEFQKRYVPYQAALLDTDPFWSKSDDEIQINNEEFELERDFLKNQNLWHVVIGGTLGSGKTSFAKKITIDYADAYLDPINYEKEFIPVLVFLKNGIDEIYQKNNLETLISRILDKDPTNKRKVLLILDGLDELSSDPEKLWLVLEKLNKCYNDTSEKRLKMIVTTNIQTEHPHLTGSYTGMMKIDKQKFVRLLPFNS